MAQFSYFVNFIQEENDFCKSEKLSFDFTILPNLDLTNLTKSMPKFLVTVGDILEEGCFGDRNVKINKYIKPTK